MAFASPIWLLLLLPWGALTAWLLWGRRRQTGVPFLDLWRGDVESPRAKRSIRLPPLALLAALAGILLAIVAAAQPVLAHRSRGLLVTVIVDRGITMSATGRLAEVIDRARRELTIFEPGPVDLVMVPDGGIARTDRSGWMGLAHPAEVTALDTRAAVQRAVVQAMKRNDSPVIVLSDHDALPADARIVQMAPEGTLHNVALTGLAIRESPHRQAMVTVRNDSELERGSLTLRSGEQVVQHAIELPIRGMQRNIFIDLAQIASPLVAELGVADDLPADNRRWLVRERARPRVEVRSDVPAPVRRVVQAYQQARPGGEGGGVVAVAGQLDPDQPGIMVSARSAAAAPESSIRPSVTVQDHPVTRNIAWSQAERSIEPVATPGPTGGAWQPVVSIDGVPLVALSTGPVRQAWTALTGGEFARTAEFVVLWTNLLDFVGGDGEAWAAHHLRDLDTAWKPVEGGKPSWPGLWTRGDGVVRAFNAPDVAVGDPSSIPAPANRLSRLARDARARTELLPWIALAALAMGLFAAAAWPRSRLTPPAGLRTV